MTDHNHQKKIALINDFTGFGRCSIPVQLPIISKLKIQCCPLPTAIFSNHTGFDQFFHTDYTENMTPYVSMWKHLELSFKGILSGFLGSKEQIQIVSDFIRDFKSEDTIVVVDPVMGDYGHLYPTYTEAMAENMAQLVALADIVVPNVTEACILTHTPYKDKWTTKELLVIARKVSALGPKKVVITGISQKTYVSNLCYESADLSDGLERYSMLKTHKIGNSRSGTGDIFSAIIASDAVNGIDFQTSVRKASKFIQKCILTSIALDIPLTDGVAFEEVLSELK